MICKECKFISEHCASGQGFTKYTCELCGKEAIWHNTHTPNICPECSDKFKICEYCKKPIKD